MNVGIITMHRVKNYGSALQTYALVEYIKKLGYHVETIDYVFPNVYHLKQTSPSSYKDRLKKKLKKITRTMLLEPFLRRDYKFNLFRTSHLALSKKMYKTKEDLLNNPPLYDIYITGSDQVWNECKIFDDDSFFCDFAPKGKKVIAFGASITTNKLSKEFQIRLQKQLLKYDAIGVREASSVPLLKKLDLDKKRQLVNTCDPTLLLDSSDYDKLADESKIKINYNYILVHQLEYNFSAEPAISSVVNSAKQHFGCGVVLIDHMFKHMVRGDHKICSLGPNEFVWLFKHAKAIVTSSFHGTMFSIIYRKPFISVAPPKGHLDSRIGDTLVTMGLRNHLVYNDGSKLDLDWIEEYSEKQEFAIKEYIDKSKKFLQQNLI